jgi:DNA-binding YbaB/EbfC family protein
MFSKIKKVQELRNQAKQIQSALAQEVVEGQGGWGKVKITMNGNQEVQKVEIDPEIMNDKAKVENGVKEAINDCVKKVQRVMATKMQQMGGLNLPGM